MHDKITCIVYDMFSRRPIIPTVWTNDGQSAYFIMSSSFVVYSLYIMYTLNIIPKPGRKHSRPWSPIVDAHVCTMYSLHYIKLLNFESLYRLIVERRFNS